MISYTAGQGYRDGHRDRNNGNVNRNLLDDVTTNDPYWREYKEGYGDADRKIMEDARRSVVNENKKYLADDPWSVS